MDMPFVSMIKPWWLNRAGSQSNRALLLELLQARSPRPDWVILSAFRACAEACTNCYRTERLQLRLEERRPVLIRTCFGISTWGREISKLVVGLPENAALQLAAEFEQENIISPRGLIWTDGRPHWPLKFWTIHTVTASVELTDLSIGHLDVHPAPEAVTFFPGPRANTFDALVLEFERRPAATAALPGHAPTAHGSPSAEEPTSAPHCVNRKLDEPDGMAA